MTKATERPYERLVCITRLSVAQVSIEIADGEDYPGMMSDHDIARFRAQADECREQAERAINPLDQRTVAAAGGRLDQDGAGSGEAARQRVSHR